MNLKRIHFKSAFTIVTRMASKFSTVEKSMDKIRMHLSKFKGGSVDLIKRDDGLALVVLNHEKKKNAITGKMMADLSDIVEDLKSWSSGKGVVLKGSSGNFCSGGDLDFVKQMATPEEGFMMSTYMQNVLNSFQRLPLISVALIEGIGALGGGAELSVACDFLLMNETCRGIGFVHAKMGLLPAWGGTNRLIEKVGFTHALEILSTAKILSPDECFKIGLINDIVPAGEDSEDFALSWLRKRTSFDTEVVKNIKMSVSSARDFPREYEKERSLFAPFWGGPAHKEALEKNIKHIPGA